MDLLIDQQVIAAPGEDNDPLRAVQAEENIQLESLRKHSSRELLVCHLNINSIQNKFEELADLIKRLNVHVMFISETKIDASYSNNRFTIPGSLFTEMIARKEVAA